MIGGAGKWKNGILQKSKVVDNRHISITAQLLEKLSDAYVVQLSWQPATLSFAEIIEEMGDTPLPPYIKRKAEEADKERYQTVYAKTKVLLPPLQPVCILRHPCFLHLLVKELIVAILPFMWGRAHLNQ